MEGLDRFRDAQNSLDEWGEAYGRVESYLGAHGMDNRLLMAVLVDRVLDTAVERRSEAPRLSPTTLAIDAADSMMAEWFGEVLGSGETSAHRLLAQGRLAMRLADLPQRWQEWFLQPPPLPEDFVQAMRESFVRAGPDFERSRMVPRPIDYGPISVAAERTWKLLESRPFVRRIIFAGIVLLTLGVLWYLFW